MIINLINSLNVDLSFKEDTIQTILPLGLATVCFIIFLFISLSDKIKNRLNSKYGNDRASVIHFIFTRLLGFFFLGVIPIIVCLLVLKEHPLSYYGLSFRSDTSFLTLLSIVVLALIVFPLSRFSARKPENLEYYPLIRAKVWTPGTVWISLGGWAIYLLGYELLYRGVLLMPLAQSIGVWPAIFVNIAFYSATHIHKGMQEAVGAIPLGLVLCLITLETGTIWTAFIVHLVMAATNSITSMKNHPEIVFRKSSNK